MLYSFKGLLSCARTSPVMSSVILKMIWVSLAEERSGISERMGGLIIK